MNVRWVQAGEVDQVPLIPVNDGVDDEAVLEAQGHVSHHEALAANLGLELGEKSAGIDSGLLPSPLPWSRVLEEIWGLEVLGSRLWALKSLLMSPKLYPLKRLF